MKGFLPLATATLLLFAARSTHAAEPGGAAGSPPVSSFPAPAEPAAPPPAQPSEPPTTPAPAAPAEPAAVEQAPTSPAPLAPAPPPQTLDTPDPRPEPPESRRQPQANAEPRWRGTFFGSFAVGPGLFHAASGSASDSRTFSGGAVSGHMAVGSRTKPGLVLGAALSHDVIFSLSAEDEVVDGDEPDLTQVRFSVTLVAFFLDAYLNGDVGPHIELMAGIASLNASRSQGDEIENPMGLGGSIGAGYNFRVGKKTTLGALARLVYAPLSVDEGSGTQVETLVPALLLTGSVF